MASRARRAPRADWMVCFAHDSGTVNVRGHSPGRSHRISPGRKCRIKDLHQLCRIPQPQRSKELFRQVPLLRHARIGQVGNTANTPPRAAGELPGRFR